MRLRGLVCLTLVLVASVPALLPNMVPGPFSAPPLDPTGAVLPGAEYRRQEYGHERRARIHDGFVRKLPVQCASDR